MRDILRHINSVEGVIGSAVFSEQGNVIAHAFPALIDAHALKNASVLVLECSHGLQITQSLEILDLRFAEGRILVKHITGAMLYLLCAKNVNLQVVITTLNLAVKKMEELLSTAATAPIPAVPSSTASLASDTSLLMLPIAHLANREASSSFDSLGMIAVTQQTANSISEFYSKTFKKLTLTSPSSATNGTFPVMVMKDMETRFDGTIIVGPGIEKKLKINEGDLVEIKIA